MDRVNGPTLGGRRGCGGERCLFEVPLAAGVTKMCGIPWSALHRTLRFGEF